jgi:ankyrin repeat protein
MTDNLTDAHSKIFTAVLANNTIAARQLLQPGVVFAGAHANTMEPSGHWSTHTSLLSTACQFGGSHQMVKILLENNADVNLRNSDGTTALHHAAITAQERSFILLILAGADVHAKCHRGDTALYFCTLVSAVHPNGTCKDMAAMLVENGADINTVNAMGQSSLHNAASGGDIEMANFLIEKGVNTELVNRDEQRAEQDALTCGHHSVARLINAETERVLRDKERLRRREVCISNYMAFAMGNHKKCREQSYIELLDPDLMRLVMSKLRILYDA